MTTKTLPHVEIALRKIFLPIAKLLIRAGFHFEQFLILARRIYIEAAIDECNSRGEIVTDSRLSIMTGVARRDVREFSDSGIGQIQVEPTNAHVIAEILTIWYSDPNFLGPYGVPLELSFVSDDSRNFSALATVSGKKIDPNKILVEMLDAGIVSRVGEDHFRPNARTFFLSESLSAAAFEHLGNSVFNLANTIGWNLNSRNSTKLVERTIFSDHGLTYAQQQKFDDFLKEKVKELSSDVDNWLKDAEGQATDANEERLDIGVSIFEYANSKSDSPGTKDHLSNL